MDAFEYRRRLPREATFTAHAYGKSPSTTIADPQIPRKAPGAASPLNAFDPNAAVYGAKSIADLGAEERPTTAQKYHNEESIPSDWPKQGVRRVELPQHRDAHRGLRMVCNATVNANARHLNIVGSDAIAVPVDKKALARPLSGIRCRALPQREGAWMHRTFDESQRPHTTTSMEIGAAQLTGCPAPGHDENPEVVHRQEHPTSWDHTLSRLQRLRMTVCDHAIGRTGGPAAFYSALVRGQVGGIATPRVQAATSPFGLGHDGNARKLTIGSLRDQLEALTGQPLQVAELAFLLYGTRPGDPFPSVVAFRDFVDAFGSPPATLEMATYRF